MQSRRWTLSSLLAATGTGVFLGTPFLRRVPPPRSVLVWSNSAWAYRSRPVEIERMTNTNKAGVQSDKDRGMAPLAYRIVLHGVYVMPYFVNPTAARKSGCTDIDIEAHEAPDSTRVYAHGFLSTAHGDHPPRLAHRT